jgi:cobalamin-dependent methionine synthase I
MRPSQRGGKTAAAARARPCERLQLDWANYQPKPPLYSARARFETWDLAELARYIDWTPFFQTWELKGRYPKSSTTRSRALRPASFSPMRRPCCEDHRRKMVHAARRDRLLACRCGGRRHRFHR